MKKLLALILLLTACGETVAPDDHENRWPVSDYWSVQCTEGSDKARCDLVKCLNVEQQTNMFVIKNICEQSLMFYMSRSETILGQPKARIVPYSIRWNEQLWTYQRYDDQWEISSFIEFEVKPGQMIGLGVPIQCDQWKSFSSCETSDVLPTNEPIIVDATHFLALPQLTDQKPEHVDINCGYICSLDTGKRCANRPNMMKLEYRFDINARCNP